MKKSLLSTLFITFSILSFSQARFGIIGGLNLASQSFTVSQGGASATENGNTIASFHVGGFAAIPMSKNVDFMPELLLSGKGSNFTSMDYFGTTTTIKFRPYYIDLPLNFVYKTPIKKGGVFFIGAGPQIGIGLFGNLHIGDSSAKIFQADNLKRFDLGINFIAGIELKSGIRFSANYCAGLINTADISNVQSGDPDQKFTNSVFSFSVGYILGKKK